MISLSVDADISAGTDLLGKSVSDLQSDVSIVGNAITGTLKHVTGYTGFSGAAEEQEGNYLVLHFDADEGAAITVELVGGTSGPVTLDEDGIVILRIADPATQSVKATAQKDGVSKEQIYTIADLTLLDE